MVTARSSLLIGALFFMSACVPVTSKIRVFGPENAIAGLVGEWRGDYSGSELTGRKGTIEFTLRSVGDTAQGAVFMEHEAPPNVTSDLDPRLPAHAQTPLTTPLFIRFVAVEGPEVVGVLESYRDPDCGCQLITTFRGRLQGDVIEGTFESNGDGLHHLPQTGRWRVQRVRR